METVTGSKGEGIETNPKPVVSDANGQIFDLVSVGAFTDFRVDRATAIRVFDENTQKLIDVTTQMILSLRLPSAEVTFQRRLTNADANGYLRPPGPPRIGPAPNFTVTVGDVTVKRLP